MWYFERLFCPFDSARRHEESMLGKVLSSLSFIDRVLRLPCGLPCEVGKSCTCKRRRSVVGSHMGVPGEGPSMHWSSAVQIFLYRRGAKGVAAVIGEHPIEAGDDRKL